MAAWREPPRPVPAYVRRRQRRQYAIGAGFAIMFGIVVELARAAGHA